jgi:hypothetical protein
VSGNPGALGVLGFSFLDENLDRVKAVSLNGIAPSVETISNLSYPGARQIYLYAKGEHVGAVPGMKEFLAEYARAWGPDKYLALRGLIPPPAGSSRLRPPRPQFNSPRSIRAGQVIVLYPTHKLCNPDSRFGGMPAPSMSLAATTLLVLGLGLLAWVSARAKAAAFAGVPGRGRPHSLPGYHGWYVALWAILPALLFLTVWAPSRPAWCARRF